jgi:hypothetical protein
VKVAGEIRSKVLAENCIYPCGYRLRGSWSSRGHWPGEHRSGYALLAIPAHEIGLAKRYPQAREHFRDDGRIDLSPGTLQTPEVNEKNQRSVSRTRRTFSFEGQKIPESLLVVRDPEPALERNSAGLRIEPFAHVDHFSGRLTLASN